MSLYSLNPTLLAQRARLRDLCLVAFFALVSCAAFAESGQAQMPTHEPMPRHKRVVADIVQTTPDRIREAREDG